MGTFLRDENATDKVVDVWSNHRHRVLQTLCFRYAIFILFLFLVGFLSSCVEGDSSDKQQDKSADLALSDNSKTLKRDKGARFTGKHAEAGVDSDGDGKYNFLSAEAEIEVVTDGNYGIYGSLMFNGREITSRPRSKSAAPSYFYLSSGRGIKSITLSFSGEDIYKSKKSGMYTVELRLIDESGAYVDRAAFETSSFSYKEFREFQR